MTDFQTLKEGTLSELVELGGQEFLDELIEIFFEHTPSKIIEAENAMAAGNLNDVERSAHSIKSSAGNMGGEALHHLCQTIENQARDQVESGLAELVSKLKDEYEKVAAILQSRHS